MKVEINQEQAEILLYAVSHWISYNDGRFSNNELEELKSFEEKLNNIKEGNTND